jgi:hypothetical protein
MNKTEVKDVKSLYESDEKSTLKEDEFYNRNKKINKITDRAYRTEKNKIKEKIKTAKKIYKAEGKSLISEVEAKNFLIKEIRKKSTDVIDDSIIENLQKLNIRDLKNINSFLGICDQTYEGSVDKESVMLQKIIKTRILLSGGKIAKVNNLFDITEIPTDEDIRLTNDHKIKAIQSSIGFKDAKLKNELYYLRSLDKPDPLSLYLFEDETRPVLTPPSISPEIKHTTNSLHK